MNALVEFVFWMPEIEKMKIQIRNLKKHSPEYIEQLLKDQFSKIKIGGINITFGASYSQFHEYGSKTRP